MTRDDAGRWEDLEVRPAADPLPRLEDGPWST